MLLSSLQLGFLRCEKWFLEQELNLCLRVKYFYERISMLRVRYKTNLRLHIDHWSEEGQDWDGQYIIYYNLFSILGNLKITRYYILLQDTIFGLVKSQDLIDPNVF